MTFLQKAAQGAAAAVVGAKKQIDRQVFESAIPAEPLRQQIELWAAANGCTWKEAIGRLVERGLAKE
jgi:hypothetical protein